MTTRKPALHAVQPGERPRTQRRPKTIVQAAISGDHLALLKAMRKRLAQAVADPNCPARDLAALSRRLQELDREIVEIESERARQEAEGDATGSADEEWDSEAL